MNRPPSTCVARLNLPQPLPTQFRLGKRSSSPGEVSGPCNPEGPKALLGLAALPGQGGDERVLPCGRTSLSAKRAEAFLVISSSVSSCRIRFLA